MDLMGSLQEEGGLVPTVSSYNVVVEALAKAGEWMKALEILAEMKENGLRPTEFTYSHCMAGEPTALVPWIVEQRMCCARFCCMMYCRRTISLVKTQAGVLG